MLWMDWWLDYIILVFFPTLIILWLHENALWLLWEKSPTICLLAASVWSFLLGWAKKTSPCMRQRLLERNQVLLTQTHLETCIANTGSLGAVYIIFSPFFISFSSNRSSLGTVPQKDKADLSQHKAKKDKNIQDKTEDRLLLSRSLPPNAMLHYAM